jgi:hypothetical protein
MSNTWTYGNNNYSSEDLVDAAVLDMKSRLENNPTDWVIVKELAGNVSDGWIIPTDALTDNEINNLDVTKHYSVSAIITADTDLGLTSEEAVAKIATHRNAYSNFKAVNTIFKLQTYAPTNVDMSVYTSS